MDEILYTTDSLVDVNNMILKIKSACIKYGIQRDANKEITQDTLKKHFATLRNLINVEFTGGFRKAYARDVYERAKHGHRYGLMKNTDTPVTAFKLCFSYSEAMTMRSELIAVINRLKNNGYIDNTEEFGTEYPMLFAMSNISDYNPSTRQGREQVNSINEKQKWPNPNFRCIVIEKSVKFVA